jgi:hypothetical protein
VRGAPAKAVHQPLPQAWLRVRYRCLDDGGVIVIVVAILCDE